MVCWEVVQFNFTLFKRTTLTLDITSQFIFLISLSFRIADVLLPRDQIYYSSVFLFAQITRRQQEDKFGEAL